MEIIRFYRILQNINIVRYDSKEDKEKEKTRRENLSKFIYQLANTCFTAMVVVAAVGLVLGVEDAKPYALLLGVGLFSTIFLALFADNILKRNNYGRNVYCFRWCRNRCMQPLSLVCFYEKR